MDSYNESCFVASGSLSHCIVEHDKVVSKKEI
jgi:hypothetical protein